MLPGKLKHQGDSWPLSVCLSATMSIFIFSFWIFQFPRVPWTGTPQVCTFYFVKLPPGFFTYAHNMVRLRAVTALFRLTCLHGFDVSPSEFEIMSLWTVKLLHSASPLPHSGFEWEGRETGNFGQTAMFKWQCLTDPKCCYNKQSTNWPTFVWCFWRFNNGFKCIVTL